MTDRLPNRPYDATVHFDHQNLVYGVFSMFDTLLLAQVNVTWHMVPLALAISLVYSASRYELPEYILVRALRLFLQILGFMGGAFLVLWVLTYGL